MKRRRAFLAKVLVAAMAVTAVLPGTLTANAATIVTTTAKQSAETADDWSVNLGRENLGGETYWHLQSDATMNNNNNSDYSATTAPAVILDMDKDFTVDEAGEAKKVSVDIYPNGTQATMRFGIMVKYVDATHWAYLNYDVGSWLLEYKCDSLNNYPSISELSGASLTDYKDTNITITYTSASQLDITYTPDGGDTISAVINDASCENVLSALEEYAATAGQDGAAAPIRFGFKAGTYSGNITDVNLKNMELDDESLMDDNWDWVVAREGQVFAHNDIIGGVNYSVLDGREAEGTVVSEDSAVTNLENGSVSAVVRTTADNQAFAVDARYTEDGAVKVGYDGVSWYYTVGTKKTTIAGAAALDKEKDYTLSIAVENDKLSASVAPVDGEETEAVELVSDADVSAVAAGSIALETAAGTKLLVRNVNYENIVKSAPEALQAEYERVKGETGESNTDNKYYSDKWETYKTALDAAKEMIDSDEEITQAQADAKKAALTSAFNGLVLVDGTDLQSKYNELEEEEQGLATDESWAAFQKVLADAKAVLDKIAKKESVSSTDVSGAISSLNSAKSLLVERAATTEEKADLQTGYDGLKDTANNCYTEDSWNTFTAALEVAKNALESGTATNTQVKAALDALNTAFEGLTAKAAGAEDLQGLLEGYDSVKATENTNYTADSWKAFQDALKNAEAVLAKGEDATQFEVQNALKALQDAKASLKTEAAPAPVKVAFAQAAYTVDATATVETKVDANAAVTYSTSDAAVATVDAKGVVTGVKAGTAVITAAAGDVKATTTVTVTTPKITLTAASAKLQVKKSTKAIQVETKLDTDSVVSWKSSNTKVATVTKAGKVKAKKVGTTKLTVTMKSGATATCKLKVQKAKVVTKSIKVSSTKVTLSAGETYTIGAKRNPITATEKITYATSKKKVATVSKKGVITAKAKGTSKITVKCNGKKKVITVTVK